MCSRNMSDTLSLMVALYYLEPEHNPKDEKPYYSYENLSIVFDRSKSTISIAVDEKRARAKEIIDSYQDKVNAKEIAKKQLIDEEKAMLIKNRETINQTTEQTPIQLE